MSGAIGKELQVFLSCLWYGTFLVMVYDSLRLLRGLIRHASWVIGLEDLIFWIWAAFFLFVHFFKDTYGAVRSYQLLGVAVGGVLWEIGCGRFLTKKLLFVSKWLKFHILRCRIFMYLRKAISLIKRVRSNR